MFLYTHFHFSSLYWVETKYIYYESKLLAPVSTLLIRLKLVYGLFGNTNMYSTLDISQELETNLVQHKRSKALTVPSQYIYCPWNAVRIRVRPRFFDQVGHETMYASSRNRHFFTKSCHRQTYQHYEQSQQKLVTFLENKVS